MLPTDTYRDMYDSKNLPLSKRKIIKKSLAAAPRVLSYSLILAILLFLPIVPIVYLKASTGLGVGQISAIGAILIFVVAAGLEIFYQYLYYRFYYYNFTDDGAEIRKGVVSRATGHVRYGRLQNIYVDQDLLDRVFGL